MNLSADIKLSGDPSLSGDSSPSGSPSAYIAPSGDGVEIPSNLFEINSETPVKHEWDFEKTGEPVIFSSDSDLPLDYMVPGDVYIKIQSFDTNSSELIEFTFYRFQIYRKGFENKTGYLTNEIGYSDPADCLEAAITFIERNRKLIFETYTELNDDLIAEGFTAEDFNRFISNTSSFIPDDIYELNYRTNQKEIEKRLEKMRKHSTNSVIFKI